MSNVKLSAPDWCFYRPGMEPGDYYERVAALGVGAVEMVVPERFDAARAAGLEILNLAGPGMMEGLNRPANHEKLVPEMKALIEQAAANDIGAVIVFSGNRDGQSDEEGLENVAQGLEQLLPDATALGVELWFEMLCARDHPDYQADHARYGFALKERVGAIGRTSLRILYDVYHMRQMGEPVEEDLLGGLEHVAHIHLADLPNRGCPATDEHIPFRALRERVDAAGYTGYWGLEFLPRGDTLEELARGVRHMQ